MTPTPPTCSTCQHLKKEFGEIAVCEMPNEPFAPIYLTAAGVQSIVDKPDRHMCGEHTDVKTGLKFWNWGVI